MKYAIDIAEYVLDQEHERHDFITNCLENDENPIIEFFSYNHIYSKAVHTVNNGKVDDVIEELFDDHLLEIDHRIEYCLSELKVSSNCTASLIEELTDILTESNNLDSLDVEAIANDLKSLCALYKKSV